MSGWVGNIGNGIWPIKVSLLIRALHQISIDGNLLAGD